MTKPREGIPCPECHREMSHSVLDTRMVEGTLRRRRECGCGCRFVTVEAFSHTIERKASRSRSMTAEVRDRGRSGSHTARRENPRLGALQ